MASTSASTVSVQKTASTAASSATLDNNVQQRRRSCDTVCSSNSSCFLRKRKPVHPLATSVKTYGTRSSSNVVKQRVMSAKLIKLRSIQSELNDANFHLVELAKENRALKALQRRQDKALMNYEGVNAELPKLIKNHEEEIRVLQEKNKAMKKQLKEATEQLKYKEEELQHVKEQYRKLTLLTKDKHLPEREKLAEQVEELKDSLSKSENQITMLNRKLILEQKNSKFKLVNESQRVKQIQRDLSQALTEVDRLNTLLDARGKFISANCKKRFPNTQSVSLVTLGTASTFNPRTESASATNIKEEDAKSEGGSTTDLKLEPLTSQASTNGIISNNRKDELEFNNESSTSNGKITKDALAYIKNNLPPAIDNLPLTKDNLLPTRDNLLPTNLTHSKENLAHIRDPKSLNSNLIDTNGIMMSPLESVKARLSANLQKYKNADLEEAKTKLGTLNLSETDLLDIQQPKSIFTASSHMKSRPTSSQKLEKLTETIQKACSKPDNDLSEGVGAYCNQIVSSVKTSNMIVTKHNETLESAKSTTEDILSALKETDQMEKKLRSGKPFNKDDFVIPEHDMELVNKIWQDEYSFQKNANKSMTNIKKYDFLSKSVDKNGNNVIYHNQELEGKESRMNRDGSSHREGNTHRDVYMHKENTNLVRENHNGEMNLHGENKLHGENNLLGENNEYRESKGANLYKENNTYRDTNSYRDMHREINLHKQTNIHKEVDFHDEIGVYKEANMQILGSGRKDAEVGLEEKRKLLATLKAIDNGDSVESEKEMPVRNKRKLHRSVEINEGIEHNELHTVTSMSNSRRLDIMNELFGNI